MDRPPTTIDRSDRLIASESVNMGSKKKRVTEANKHFVKLWPMGAFVGCQVWVLHEDETLRRYLGNQLALPVFSMTWLGKGRAAIDPSEQTQCQY